MTILHEVDHPHAGSTWPATQDPVQPRIGHLDEDPVSKLIHPNAEVLFRWPTR
jgi:hypothetical protein